MHDEIFEELSRKHGLPKDQIKLVINSLYDGLRYYLTHPLEAKDNITIHNFLAFYIDTKKIEKYIKRLKLKTFKKQPTSEESQIEFYDELLQIKKKYERQKKESVFNKQLSKRTQNETYNETTESQS